ncbi:hypothetical protein EON79_15835 [bacterium]|nr:MAG: hypothetical protein EON79_15835 [bacterium]
MRCTLPLLGTVLIGVVLTAGARADRLINVPEATKLVAGTVRYEQMYGLSNRAIQRESFLYAVDDTVEIEARHFRSSGRDDTTLDLYATIISPFKGYAPGFAIGVRDALDATRDGFRPWIAVTFREPYQIGEIERGADLTIGAFFGQRGSALVGFSIPVGPDLRFLAENDGYRLSAGVQYAPIRNLELRLLTEDLTPLGSFRYSLRF